MSRVGPKLTLVASCSGCDHMRKVRYAAQGGPGWDVSCHHPTFGAPKEVGDTQWAMPAWCPELAAAKARFLAEEGAK